jgi:hypothetical protein
MTAVEWLINEIDMQYPEINVKRKEWMIDKAKEMEKEQIVEARNNGFLASGEGWNGEYGIEDVNNLTQEIKSEEYYNQTFKSE